MSSSCSVNQANLFRPQQPLFTTIGTSDLSDSDSVLNSDLLCDYLSDCGGLGVVRFVVVGPGAILETIGSFDNLRYADTVKGRLATVSSESPNFECHIRLNEVKEVKNVIVEKFDKKLRITRFIGETVAAAIDDSW